MSQPASVPLLSTKLYRAAEVQEIVPRARLFRLLDEALRHPLTLICAPAGYGKSTLVRTWLGQLQHPSAWVLLDQQDNALIRLLLYVTAAIEQAFPGRVAGTQQLLHAPAAPTKQLLLHALINELSGITTHYVVVLDEFEWITDPDALQFLSDLITHAPGTFHLALIARDTPALPVIDRLRTRGQVVEIRADALAFNTDETSEMAQRLLGQPASLADVSELQAESEGWVAGLRVMLSARRAFPDRALRTSTGPQSLPGAFEPLGAEMFARFRPTEQALLIRTSLLDQVCLPLASSLMDEALDEADVAFIRTMVRTSAFVTALDEHGEWFRYHPLFRQFLDRLLRLRHNPDVIRGLHLNAAHWLEAHGQLDQAVHHVAAGGGDSAVAAFIARHRGTLMDDHQWERLATWIARLPEPVRHSHPEIVLVQAFLASNQSRMRELRALVDTADRLLSAQPDHANHAALSGELAVLRGVLAGWAGDSKALIEMGGHALRLLPPHRMFVVNAAQLILAAGYLERGERDKTFSLTLELLQDETRHSVPQSTLVLQTLCLYYFQAGLPVEAEAMAERLLQLGTDHEHLAATAMGHYFLGTLRYEMNNLPAAVGHFQAVLDHPFQVEPIYCVQAACGLALTHHALGRPADAAETVRRAWNILLQIGTTELLPLLTMLRADLDIRSGVAAEISEPEIERSVGWFALLRGWYDPALTVLRLWLLRGDPESLHRAASLAAALMERSESLHRRRAMIRVGAVQALIEEAQGAHRDAVRTLERAFVLLDAGGGARLILDAGPEIADLIRKLPATTTNTLVRARLYGESSLPSPDGTRKPLSEREMEVLRLMHDGLSNHEISVILYVSLGTVKQHVHHIYQKLGVSSRTRALMQARRLGLIPQLRA